ncbi:hypothetical protein ACLOJK_013051 [Asimina triloba]
MLPSLCTFYLFHPSFLNNFSPTPRSPPSFKFWFLPSSFLLPPSLPPPTASHYLSSCLDNTHMTSRRRSMVSKEITEDEVKHLISALQALQPELQAKSISRAATATVIEEACDHIRRLHREIEGLSEKLAHLLEEMEERDSAGGVEIIRNLLAVKSTHLY